MSSDSKKQIILAPGSSRFPLHRFVRNEGKSVPNAYMKIIADG